ncbi:MAG: hypothetical protein NZ765_05090, partial [Anaerolineae bacterium]|nr:hypothetical protein [Anaerolineae bacterium]
MPRLTTWWKVLRWLDAAALRHAVHAWAQGWGAVTVVSLDAKRLRRGKRGELPAVREWVLAA